MYDILFKTTSSGDVGTMCSNMNAVNQVNAKTKNVLDNFNYCKSFVKLESAAFITAATMQHFNMMELTDKAETFVPPAVLSDDKWKRRLWLHQKVKAILQEYVMNEQEQYYERVQQLVSEMNTTACSVCGKQYKYKKAKINHEKKVHLIEQIDEQPVASNDPKEKVVDDRFNYACTRLSLGMLLFNFDDAVKEGDGERVMRCWKFMMLIFKAYHHTKYSFAALQLQISIKALLTPRQAHSLIWNRMVNTKGGMGKNISMDLRLEQLNKLLKDMLRCLGANITQNSSERCIKALKLVEEILSSIDSELNVKTPKGQHITAKRDKDFKVLVDEISKRGELFTCNANSTRQYQEFPGFNGNILHHLNLNQVNAWISQHLSNF
jgi:serine palmitoyltransferase